MFNKTDFVIRRSSLKVDMFKVSAMLGCLAEDVQGVSQLLKQSDWAQIQDFK